MIKTPYPHVQNVIRAKSLINHGSKDVQYEYIDEEERIQDEYIHAEKEKKKNIELMIGCIRMMCGKYQTHKEKRYEQRTM